MVRSRLAGLGLIGLGLGAAAGSLLGPLAFNVIKWRIAANTENQILGQDVVTLVLVAPVSIAAGALWLRGHRLAPVMALGPTTYSLYTFLSYILGPDYHRYAGNNEKTFPLFLGLTLLSWTISAKAWSSIEPSTLPPVSRRVRIGLATSMLVVAGLLALAWVQQIGLVMTGDQSRTEYQDNPGLFWVIKTFDLAFVAPIALATGIGLLRERPLALRATYGVAGFLTLMGAAVSSMGIVMLVQDDPAATVAFPAIVTSVTLMMGVLTVSLYRTYVMSDPPELHAPQGRPSSVGATSSSTR